MSRDGFRPRRPAIRRQTGRSAPTGWLRLCCSEGQTIVFCRLPSPEAAKHGDVIVCATTACLRARLRTAPIRSRERQRADAQLLITFCLDPLFQLGELLPDFRGILGVRLQFEVSGVGFLGGLGILGFFRRHTDAQPCIAVAIVPLGGIAIATRRGVVVAHVEIVIAHPHILLGLKRIEGIGRDGQRFVLFGRGLGGVVSGRLRSLRLQLALALRVERRSRGQQSQYPACHNPILPRRQRSRRYTEITAPPRWNSATRPAFFRSRPACISTKTPPIASFTWARPRACATGSAATFPRTSSPTPRPAP